MFQLTVFGVGYYVDPTAIPKWVYHKLSFYVGKFGENLDVSPAWVRHGANFLAAKFIRTTF